MTKPLWPPTPCWARISGAVFVCMKTACERQHHWQCDVGKFLWSSTAVLKNVQLGWSAGSDCPYGLSASSHPMPLTLGK